MSAKLYEITREYNEILEDLYDDDGSVNKEALMKLNDTEKSLKEKGIAIVSYVKNIESTIKAIAEARKAMADREKRLQKKMEDLQGYLLDNMDKCGIQSITCPYFDIKIKKNPVSVDIIDELSIPMEYMKEKIEYKPDKPRMKEEMMAGVIIPGAGLKQGLRLDIK